MKDYNFYLDKIGEIGSVEQALHTLVYVNGLPRVKPSEVVLFETGEVGQVMSLSKDKAEVLVISKDKVDVGTSVVRTGEQLKVRVSESLLGKTLDPLGVPIGKAVSYGKKAELRYLDVPPPGINVRKVIDVPFQTGVTLVDLVIPLGKGQRELVIGNRKTGKTSFLFQSTYSAASQGMVCVYAVIAKKRLDIKIMEDFFKEKGIDKNVIVVASSSADPAGLVYLTPFTAMSIAEYFRDQGKDVLVILDDLTAHAKYYREVTLLAGYFPGRSSYPGDIFYLHSRLLERAGNFIIKDPKSKKAKSASITCLPVGELVMGDLSGYIPTNLMAMTDGHIFFDIDLYNEGRRPPINPFLSVTRVGRQTQTQLLRDLSRNLTSFLVKAQDLRQFMHFGAELGEESKRILELSDRLITFFDQSSDVIIPLHADVMILTLLWAGFWSRYTPAEMKKEVNQVVATYIKDTRYKAMVDNFITQRNSFNELIEFVKRDETLALGLGRKA